MHANKPNRYNANGHLMKIIIADEKAIDNVDQIQTDRDGELLPDPSDDPIEIAANRSRNARLNAVLKYREEQD